MPVIGLKPTIAIAFVTLSAVVMAALAPQGAQTQTPADAKAEDKALARSLAPPAASAQSSAEPAFSDLLDGLNCEHELVVQPDGTTITRAVHPIKPTVTHEVPLDTVRAAIQVAREIDPALADRLAALCNKDATQCEQTLRSSGQRLLALAELKQRDPQLYQAKLGELQHELQIKKLSADYQRAVSVGDTTQAQAISQQLRTVLQVQLLMSIKSRGEYICRLEEQVQQAKDELARDAAQFQQVVDQRLRELTQTTSANPAGSRVPVASKPKATSTADTSQAEPPQPQPVPAAPR